MNVYEIAELRLELDKTGLKGWTVTDDTATYHARRTYRIANPENHDVIMLHQNHSRVWFAVLSPDPAPGPDQYTPAVARNPVEALQDALFLSKQPPGATEERKGIRHAL